MNRVVFGGAWSAMRGVVAPVGGLMVAAMVTQADVSCDGWYSAKKIDLEELEECPDLVDLFVKVEEVREENPGNRTAKHIQLHDFVGLDKAGRDSLFRSIKPGLSVPEAMVGCYAMRPTDYETHRPFFDRLIRDYHSDASGAKVHETDWETSKLGKGGVLDLKKLGLDNVSMRVRVGRNLASFNLPGSMDKAERIKFEKTMLKAFAKIMADPAYGGRVYSLTPDFGAGEANPNLITPEQYKKLVKSHVMFKEMDGDEYMVAGGLAADWPYGRGCWQSDDKQCIIWFGEEDQLRIMSMKKGTKLNEVFDRLSGLLKYVESIDGIDFASNKDYGYVTTCPSNLGTGMRASVHIKVPNLCADGTDKKAKEVATPLGLSVRGTGGEDTPIGADGTIDLSPQARLFISEVEIVSALYEGIQKLLIADKKAARENRKK